MSFGEPLFVSQGDEPDKAVVKINKDYFLNQLDIDSGTQRRMLLSKETQSQYIFTQDIPKLLASEEEKV